MTRQNSTLTLSKSQSATSVSTLELSSPPKNDSSLVLRTSEEYRRAKSELAFLEEKHSEVSASDMEAYLDDMTRLFTAIRHYENSLGFTVAQNSRITPEQLKAAGFTMRDFKFYPSSLIEVKKRLPFFVVFDLSTPTDRIYSFDLCPF
ncbi:TPA: hypothetical protein KD020_003751 [Vibrio parahaemolyticus]|nr:hypothetical protein [Vibrio parahaemolyticus]HBC3544409.1 hypothetical protein [Vibrio parahaemolyticus]